MENWKDIKGYEGLYQVSDEGRVFSVRRNIIMKPTVNKIGYLIVNLTSKDGRTGINLLSPSAARKLCRDMFLICLVVIDPDRESVKMFIPDLNSDWEVQSIDAINRQISTMNAAGIKSNEIFKALAR